MRRAQSRGKVRETRPRFCQFRGRGPRVGESRWGINPLKLHHYKSLQGTPLATGADPEAKRTVGVAAQRR